MSVHEEDIKKLLEENLKVVKQNHEILEKIHKVYMYTLWMKVLWFAIIVGVPFILYYFLIEPYLMAAGIYTEQIRDALKGFQQLVGKAG
jgi:hypothetical protein